MKNLITLILAAAILFTLSNCRSFHTYAADGNGGVVRKGYLIFILFPFETAEHCVPDGAGLACSKLKLKY